MKITKFEIFSDYENMRIADQALRDLLEQNGIKEEIIGICELAFHELLNNIVDHAYKGVHTNTIQIEMKIHEKQLKIQTEDSGIQSTLNLETVSMPDPMDLMEGGYGLAIILSQMDSVNYSFENGKNIWKLQKNISS